MKVCACLLACLAVTLPVLSSAENKNQPTEPVAWGMIAGNSGCVIFAEGHKTSGRFYGVAMTTKTVGKLTLLEAQNTTFNQKEVIETQENLDGLTQQGQKDHVKFVKIPEKHTPEQLEKARSVCKTDAQ